MGNQDVQDALCRFDRLTQEDSLAILVGLETMVAQANEGIAQVNEGIANVERLAFSSGNIPIYSRRIVA
jgi:hypothetical protein